MTTVEVVWRGLDDESRLDVASVEFDADGGFVATGRQSTESYRAQWDLVVDSSWRTRLFTVDVEGYAPSSAAEDLDAPDETGGSLEPVWQRHLNLWRRDEGSRSVWRFNAWRKRQAVPRKGKRGSTCRTRSSGKRRCWPSSATTYASWRWT